MTSAVATRPAAKRAAKPTTKSKTTAAAKAAATTSAAAAPAPPPTADAKTAPKETARYADDDTARSVADRLADARTKGFTRPAVMELTGLSASAVWRAENRRVHPGEVATLSAVLDRIESGDVAPPGRRATGSRTRVADLEARIDAACRDLTDAVKTEKTVTALRKRVAATLTALAN
jgi:hypothetical protein